MSTVCNRDDNWFRATLRAMFVSLVVVAAAVLVVSGTFLALDSERLAMHSYTSVTQCLVTRDGQRAVALWWNVPATLAGWTHRVTVHDADPALPPKTAQWPGIAPSRIARGASDQTYFLGDWNGSLYEVNSLTPAARPRLIGKHMDGVVELQASADGRRLVSLSPTKLCAWNLETAALCWQQDGGHIAAIRIHTDSSRLFCGMDDGRVTVIDLRSGEQIGSLLTNPPPWPVHDIDVSPDGSLVAVVHATGELRIVPAASGEGNKEGSAACEPFCKVGWPRYARFSPCGSLLATTAADDEHDLQIWSLSSRQPLCTLRGHTRVVLGVTFAADGRLFSWGQDCSIRVWDPRQGRMLAVIPLPMPPGANSQPVVAMSPNTAQVRLPSPRFPRS